MRAAGLSKKPGLGAIPASLPLPRKLFIHAGKLLVIVLNGAFPRPLEYAAAFS